MEGDIDKILKSVERIAFSAIGLVASIYLISVVVDLGPGTYGRTLLDGISIYLLFGAVVLMLWVAYNVFSLSRPEGNRKK